MQNVRARFFEGQGGVIFGPGSQETIKVNVDGMTTADAQRTAKAVIAALDAEFCNPTSVKAALSVDITEVVKAAMPQILANTKAATRRGL